MTVNNTSPCPNPTCASCEDSLLSVIGNISGILTFGFAFTVAIHIRANAFRNAKYEMLEMKTRLESRTRDVNALQAKIINAVEKHDQLRVLEPYLKSHLWNLMSEMRKPMMEAHALLARLYQDRSSSWYRIVYSTRFVVEKTTIQQCLDRLDYRVTNLREAASDALDWNVSSKDCLFPELTLHLGILTSKNSRDLFRRL